MENLADIIPLVDPDSILLDIKSEFSQGSDSSTYINGDA